MENNYNASAFIEVSANLKYSAAVRNFVSGFLIAEDVPEKWTRRLILVTDELFMNAVRYGSSEGSKVRVKCDSDNDKVSCTIMDDGSGKSKVTAKELQEIVLKKGEEMDHHKTSGRGLSIIASEWADSCEADDLPEGGIAIKIIKYRKNLVQEAKVEKQEMTQIEPKEEEKKEPEKTEISQESKMNPNAEVQVVNFSGSIDESNLQEVIQPVREMAYDEKPYYLILDFTKLNYFNSLFIGTLADWNTRLEEKGGKLVIVGAGDAAKEILDLCGLLNIIPIYNTIDEAKQAF